MEAREDTPTEEAGQAGAGPATPAPAAPGISEQSLNKAEFHQEVGALKGSIERETANVRVFIGWLLLTFSILGLLIGFQAMNPHKYRFSR